MHLSLLYFAYMAKNTMPNEALKLFRNFGKQGGETTKKRYGTKHFSEAGKLGMAKRWGKKATATKKK